MDARNLSDIMTLSTIEDPDPVNKVSKTIVNVSVSKFMSKETKFGPLIDDDLSSGSQTVFTRAAARAKKEENENPGIEFDDVFERKESDNYKEFRAFIQSNGWSMKEETTTALRTFSENDAVESIRNRILNLYDLLLFVGFTSEYILTKLNEMDEISSVTKHFKRGIECWNAGRSNELLANLIAFIRPSGTGKSRLLRELHHRGIFTVIYLNCRSDKSGWPARSPAFDLLRATIENYGTDDAICQRIMSSFVYSVILGYELIAKTGEEITVPLSKKHESLLTRYVYEHLLRFAGDETSCSSAAEKSFNALNNLFVLRKRQILFCVDEARQLLSLDVKSSDVDGFRLFRRVLHTGHLRGAPNFLAVVVDTNATITHINSPLKSIVSTERIIPNDVRATKLLPPYHRVMTTDALCVVPSGVIMKWTPSQLAQFIASEGKRIANLYTVGRPLWVSCLGLNDSTDSIESFIDAKNLAQMKLMFHASDVYSAINEEENAFRCTLACMTLRTGFPINGRTLHAQALVSGHLAYVMYISEDRNWLEIRYPHEPILNSVAISLFRKWSMVQMRHLSRALDEKLMSPGYNGELIATLLLLTTLDAVRFEHYNRNEVMQGVLKEEMKVMGPVPVIEFIAAMRGRHQQAKVADEFVVDFENCWVTATSFIHALKFPDHRMLHHALARGYAYLTPPGWKGADALIPFIRLHDGSIGVIGVQFKRYSRKTHDGTYENEIEKKLAPHFIDPDFGKAFGVAAHDDVLLVQDDEVAEVANLTSFEYDVDQLLGSETPTTKRTRIQVAMDSNFQEADQFKERVRYCGYIGIYLQMGDGSRDTLKRDLIRLNDGTYRTAVVLDDDKSFDILNIYCKTYNAKKMFHELALQVQ